MLTDLTGKTVVTQQVILGSTNHQVSVNGLSKGLYMMHVITQQGMATYKISVE